MVLLTADWHLTSNVKDEYRWGIFKALKDVLWDHEISDIIIAGDLTDKKDRHTAVLLRRMIDEMSELLRGCGCAVHILMGNHDYITPKFPFFQVLEDVLPDDIRFYTNWELVTLNGGGKCAFVPHCWSGVTQGNLRIEHMAKEAECFVIHHDVCGARLENGYSMEEGFDTSGIPNEIPIFSGHIHVPQNVGQVRIIGSPYDIIHREAKDLGYPSGYMLVSDDFRKITRHSFANVFPRKIKFIVEGTNLKGMRLSKFPVSSQIKCEIRVSQDDLYLYPDIKEEVKQIIKSKNWICSGISMKKVSGKAQKKQVSLKEVIERSPQDRLKDFCLGEKLHPRYKQKVLGWMSK